MTVTEPIAFLFAFFPVVIATLGGLAGTPAHLIEHFRAVDASAATTFWRLRLPSARSSANSSGPRRGWAT